MNTTKDIFSVKRIAWVLLGAMFIYSVVILMLSPGTFDYGDGLAHYFISRYSWKHHHLFIDDWGKPVFTIVSSPFAQFGLKGITMFNIICGVVAGYFAYRIAEKLSISFPYLAIIFTVSAPVYFSVMHSGLTEPMFSAMLVWSIWLIMNERYYVSAIVFSFLPFVRAEYIFVLPLFSLYYILKRKYLANFLLPAGTIFFSIVGWFYYKNLFWLIGQNPYNSANSASYADAGKGDILSYVRHYPEITGTALIILLFFGLLWYVGGEFIYSYKEKQPRTNFFMEEIVLVFGGFLSIFVCHSIIWGERIFPTLGLSRYMATLIPLASIVALRGIQIISLVVPQKLKIGKAIIAVIFTIGILYSPYKLWYKIPFQLGKEEVVLAKATNWMKQTGYAQRKVYYLAPYITVGLNIDPSDFNRRGELWSMDPENPESDMVKGGILIWDAHFGPEEGRMKLESLLADDNLKLLNVFKPAENFKVIGNRDYAVYVFESNPKSIPDTLYCNAEVLSPDKTAFTGSANTAFGNANTRDSAKAHSGKYSVKLSSTGQYGMTYKVTGVAAGDSIKVTVYKYSKHITNGKLVASCGKNFYLAGDSAISQDSSGWRQIMIRFKVPADHSDFKIYEWNDNAEPVWFDDLKIMHSSMSGIKASSIHG